MAAFPLCGCIDSHTITGLVIEDHSGSPVASAHVRVLRSGGAKVLAELESNSSGRFEVPQLATGDYRVEVSKADYVGTTVKVQVAVGSARTILARLIRCGVIARTCSRPGRRTGLERNRLRVAREGDSSVWQPFARYEHGHEARVNPRGEYRLFNLPPGQYAIAVTYSASTKLVGSTGDTQSGEAWFGSALLPRELAAAHLFNYGRRGVQRNRLLRFARNAVPGSFILRNSGTNHTCTNSIDVRLSALEDLAADVDCTLKLMNRKRSILSRRCSTCCTS